MNAFGGVAEAATSLLTSKISSSPYLDTAATLHVQQTQADYMSKVQALPRKSIKKHKYNFADLLGDINYIGDEKVPMFQSRGGLASKKGGAASGKLGMIGGIKKQAESTKNASLNEKQRDMMSKFISDDS